MSAEEGVIWADGNGYTLTVDVAQRSPLLKGVRVPASGLNLVGKITPAEDSDAELTGLSGPMVEIGSSAEYNADLPGAAVKTALQPLIGQLVFGVALGDGIREVKPLRVVAVKKS